MDVLVSKNRIAKVLILGVSALLATACQKNMMPFQPAQQEPVVVEKVHHHHHHHHACKHHCKGHHHHKAHHASHHHHAAKHAKKSMTQADTTTAPAAEAQMAPAQ